MSPRAAGYRGLEKYLAAEAGPRANVSARLPRAGRRAPGRVRVTHASRSCIRARAFARVPSEPRRVRRLVALVSRFAFRVSARGRGARSRRAVTARGVPALGDAT